MYDIYVQELEYCMTQKTDNIYMYVICILIYTMCIGNNIDILCCTYNVCYFS